MSQSSNFQTPQTYAPGPIGNYLLPADVTAYRVKLHSTSDAVARFDKIMDSYLFGFVGADSVVSVVPIVGDVLSGLTTCWLFSKASEVHISYGDRVIILGLGALDVVIGSFIGVGDVADIFFRAHAWNAERIHHHIASQLTQIEIAESQLVKSTPVAMHRQNLDHLRDSLFRGGKTKKAVWIRLGIIGAACLVLLGYCSYQETLRSQRVQACEARGGWFCWMS